MTVLLENFFGRDIEPEALCRNCEYFDGGGLTPDGHPKNDHGKCLNSATLRGTTTADEGCVKFFPCPLRWPDADHD